MFLPGNSSGDEQIYCPNCKKVGLFKKLHDVYIGKLKCYHCGREFNRVDVE